MDDKLTNRKIIRCQWTTDERSPGIQRVKIVDRESGIEGIDVGRLKCSPGSTLSLDPTDGHILSILTGSAILRSTALPRPLTLRAGAHLYSPPGFAAELHFSIQTSLVHASAAQARGNRLLLHDEQYLSAVRYVLTPQYLSRRVFLHRDDTLCSSSGDPIAWFHTTMFDTQGLPKNRDGLPVFKMSYDNQSELNVVYEVNRSAMVRFALHPYTANEGQEWSDWAKLDGQTAYYLNESASGTDVETKIDPATGTARNFRNKHEIYVEPKGHVSLFCLFDPAPTGMETHLPGDYSSYAPAHDVISTTAYKRYLERIQPLDNMMKELSIATAQDPGKSLEDSAQWDVFKAARKNVYISEQKMIQDDAGNRASIIEPWRTRAP